MADAMVEVRKSGQITIPEKVRTAKKINVGDIISISIEKVMEKRFVHETD